MTGLLERARKLLAGKRPARAPASYAIRCLCGELLVGHRRDEHQVQICPSCGQSVFVLARNPLPELPIPPAELARPAVRRSVGKLVDQGISVEHAEAAADQAEARPTRTAGKKRAAPANDATIDLPAKVPLRERIGSALASLKPPRRWFSPVRLVLAACALLVAGTIYLQVQRRNYQALRENLVPDGRRGLQALVEGKFDEALERLGRAVRALDILKEEYPDADRFRQAHREVQLFLKLAATPLEDLAAGGAGPDAVAQNLRGRYVMIDAEVQPSTDGWNIGLIGYIGDRPVEVAPTRLAVLEAAKPTPGSRWIFGARIADAVLDDENRWVVRLDESSGVLLTDARLFSELGLARDPSAMAIRERQLALVEGAGGRGS